MSTGANQSDKGSSARKLRYLQAMGVDVWVGRATTATAAPAVDPAPSATIAASPARAANRPDVVVEPANWEQLRREVVTCQACALHETRTQTVFGVGNENADWLFIGEAPGADEDAQGEPFVGRAGKLLNAMLFALGLAREQVFIANVLKCRPPNNRDPRPEEVLACESFLQRQIQLIQPRIIVALGRHAAHSLLKTEQPLSRLRGQLHTYENTPLIVTYHPAYLLRSPAEKARAWADLCMAQKQVTTP